MNIDVFVSYHTDSCAHIADALVHQLESKQLRCWYAPRDTRNAYAGDINRAIKASKIFLVIVNEQSSTSKHVLNEIDIATKCLDNGLVIVPFVVVPHNNVAEDMEYYITRLHWIDAIDPPTQEQIDNVVGRILQLLGRADSRAEAAKFALVANMPNPRDKIEGRESAIAEIHQRLHAGEKLFICGMGGIGKSQVVKKYAQEHAADYDARIFANFAGTLQETIISDTQIAIAGMERGSAEADVYYQRKMNALRRLVSDRTLLVIDNFDVISDPQLDELLALPCHLLITTRTDFGLEGMDTLYLDSIDDEALRRVFRNNCTKRLDPHDEARIDELIALLNKHTMAVEIIAKQMMVSRKTVSEMIELLKSKGIRAMNLRERVRYDVNKSAETSYNIFRTLFTLEKLTDAEHSILCDLALVPNSGIDARTFHDWCELDTYEDIDSLIQRNWVLRTDEDVISLHPLVSEVVVGEMLKEFPVGSSLVDAVMGENRSRSYGRSSPTDLERRVRICLRTLSIFPHPDERSEYQHFIMALILQGYEGCEKTMKNLMREVAAVRRKIYPEYHMKNLEIMYSLILIGYDERDENERFRDAVRGAIRHLEGRGFHFLAAQFCLKFAQSFYYPGPHTVGSAENIDGMSEYAERAHWNIERLGDDADSLSGEFIGLFAYTPQRLRGSFHHIMSRLELSMNRPHAALAHEKEAERILLNPADFAELSESKRRRNLDMLAQSVMGAYGRVYYALAEYEQSRDADLRREELLLRYRRSTHPEFLSPYRNLIKCGEALGDEQLCHEYRQKLAALLEANYAPDDSRVVFFVKEYGLQDYMPKSD